jgi:membrane protein implicated in regulation of membrane protease activity
MKDLLVTIVIAVVLFEVLEHVVVPLIGAVVQRRKSSRRRASLVDQVVEIREWGKGEGLVFFKGELWKAVSDGSLAPGEKAVVRRVEGLTLSVEPLSNTPPA